MISRQHPLLSPVALVSTILFVLILAMAVWRTGGRAFSPGSLSAIAHDERSSGGFPNHAAFADDCVRCHAPFTGIATSGCLDCHTHVALQQAEAEGLHGRIAAVSCAECHLEHLGSDYDLFAAAFDQFEPAHHDVLFPLTGSHLPLECADCHQADIYIGTGSACVDCHDEPEVHIELFGDSCSHCHVDDAWRPARLAAHMFPLDHGDDGQIACAACHEESLAIYTCDSCHGTHEMVVEHEEVDLSTSELNQCVVCHPTGVEDDAKEVLGKSGKVIESPEWLFARFSSRRIS